MRKQFESASKGIGVKVDWMARFMCILLTLWSCVTMIIPITFFVNFAQDQPFLLRINLHVNMLFDICQMLSINCEDAYDPYFVLMKTVFNFFLITIFWGQHVLMARLTFKLKMIQLLPQYIIIERPMYNLASQIMFVIALSLWQPIDLVFLNLQPLEPYLNAMLVLGLLLMLKSIYDLNEYSDLMGINFMKQVWKSDIIEFNKKYLPPDSNQIVLTRVYRMCRHPMQLGLILIILGIGSIWSISRAIFTAGLLIGIFIGISREEARLEVLYPSYRSYKELVPFRLIPNIFALFSSGKQISKDQGIIAEKSSSFEKTQASAEHSKEDKKKK